MAAVPSRSGVQDAPARWTDEGMRRVRRWLACVTRCRLFAFLFASVITLLLFTFVATGSLDLPMTRSALRWLALVSLGLLCAALWITWLDYIQPTQRLKDWVQSMQAGNLSARMPIPRHGEYAELALDLNSLGQMLESLARDTEQQLARHTEHTVQKTRSLKLLYDVAASINVSRDLNDLLTRFLHTLIDLVGAKAGAVRLLSADSQMELVTSIGFTAEMAEILKADVVRLDADTAGGVSSHISSQDGDIFQSAVATREFIMVAVPLQYRDRTLGVYNLFAEPGTFTGRDDLKELLTSVGRHLGMAIEKARLDEEARRLFVMEERTRMAHELHDSLAQTLASVRFQVRVLDETLHQGDEATTWQALERIENTLDEAHTELRELIARFRAPMDQRGLLPAIEQVVNRFRQESDIHLFLQTAGWNAVLPEQHEIQILRIVQEALNNIRKHSKANTVRILMRKEHDGQHLVLIEDDGVGMSEPTGTTAPGERVGLSIMEDRAKRIGGDLRIESEPGEGVRVVLEFRYQEAPSSPFPGAVSL